MSQRGIGRDDLAFIELIGTEVEGGYLVLRKDFQTFEQELRRLRDQARRLVGKRVVRCGDVVVTAYHADRSKDRRLLRGAERDLLRRKASRRANTPTGRSKGSSCVSGAE